MLHVERFIELLVSGAMKEMDRATEHSLAVAFQRTCGELRPELVPLLDKTFRELVKDDLNGNIITIISRVGAGIVRDLGASLEPVVESEEPFMLEMMTPTTATKKRARK